MSKKTIRNLAVIAALLVDFAVLAFVLPGEHNLKCGDCDGTGMVDAATCEACGGTGVGDEPADSNYYSTFMALAPPVIAIVLALVTVFMGSMMALKQQNPEQLERAETFLMKIFRKIKQDHILDFIEIDERFAIFEVTTPEEWIGKTIGQIDIRKKFGINIMAIKQDGKMSLTILPDTVLKADETMLVLGEYKDIQKCFHI